MATKKSAPTGSRKASPPAFAAPGGSGAGPASASRSVDDVVLVHGRSEDGKTLAILRKRGDELSAGLLRVAEEGRPVHGELLRLTPRSESPMLCDVDVLHAPGAAPSPALASEPTELAPKGPTQVASPAYRSGWEAIWGDASARPRSAKREYDPHLN